MPLNIVFVRPQKWSRLKPYYYSTITAVKVFRGNQNGDGNREKNGTLPPPKDNLLEHSSALEKTFPGR